MNPLRSIKVLAILTTLGLLSGCTAPDTTASASLYGELTGVGASSQGAAQEVWIVGFQTANPHVTVNYDPAGSGTGREAFINGASAFAGTDRAFKPKELATKKFASCTKESQIIEFPAYVSAIAVAFNIPGVRSLNMDAATIAGIFTGAITSWRDPQITSQNPDVQLPDTTIKPVHRSDKSGTTGNFTQYLNAAAPEIWGAGVIEEWERSYGGEGAQGTSGVVAAIQHGNGTIGYADASRTKELGTVAIKTGDVYTPISPEAAAATLDNAKPEPSRGSLDYVLQLQHAQAGANTYPIVLVSYLAACQIYNDPQQARLTREYLNHILSDEAQQQAAKHTGSAPLTASTKQKIRAIIGEIRGVEKH
ncbi:phosphate ABC transporter substrate-binding protein PstS [Canibacter sp. lx-72]|uniref:phosphate ABC transporter substrate-binding protein PstS n=1 Tax=Canibacter zhuwentaonis TaxID=2837491 RepID=UPI001BDD68D8|nr:phosphate ABC transporter substrate-binding protein PstS [Canibacter zhuwentaonis]MBT1018767.1 phosphate ABC transporter substrate-binding protein PstS [Canibacter zhuwentaonis]MBT1035308.1 phosphate ABC transporter substrate-binding protein PstS [Canibacter zhuwentaonis]